jgi:hypothetical protein
MAEIEARWRAAARDPDSSNAALVELVVLALFPLVSIGRAPPAWQTRSLQEGEVVVPCYLSEATARHAAQGRAQVVRASGRDFLESLGERSLLVDPDDVGLLLSPQDVRDLLSLVPPAQAIGTDDSLQGWMSVDDLPAKLRPIWVGVLSEFRGVKRAYWLGRTSAALPASRRVVIVASMTEDHPRLIDAMVHALRGHYSGALRIEAQVILEGSAPDAEARLNGFSAFYCIA